MKKQFIRIILQMYIQEIGFIRRTDAFPSIYKINQNNDKIMLLVQ